MKTSTYKTSAASCLGAAALIILFFSGSGLVFGGGSGYLFVAIYSLIVFAFSFTLKKREGFGVVTAAIWINVIDLCALVFIIKNFNQMGEVGFYFFPTILTVLSLTFLIIYIFQKRRLSR